MKTLMVFSETGGATKTTTAVSLAYLAAEFGLSTLLVDLDPRGATTKWIQAEPDEEWKTVSAIIADPDPDGWAQDLAIPTGWNPNLSLLPSGRDLANRERDTADQIELRLLRSLQGVQADLVVIDCPNRQGGPLTQNALAASDGVVYAAVPGQDGTDGVDGARESVRRFVHSREIIGADAHLQELGIVLGRWHDTVVRRVARAAVQDLEETGLLLHPFIPERTIISEARMSGDWYGSFEKGDLIADAYRDILKQILPKLGLAS